MIKKILALILIYVLGGVGGITLSAMYGIPGLWNASADRICLTIISSVAMGVYILLPFERTD